MEVELTARLIATLLSGATGIITLAVRHIYIGQQQRLKADDARRKELDARIKADSDERRHFSSVLDLLRDSYQRAAENANNHATQIGRLAESITDQSRAITQLNHSGDKTASILDAISSKLEAITMKQGEQDLILTAMNTNILTVNDTVDAQAIAVQSLRSDFNNVSSRTETRIIEITTHIDSILGKLEIIAGTTKDVLKHTTEAGSQRSHYENKLDAVTKALDEINVNMREIKHEITSRLPPPPPTPKPPKISPIPPPEQEAKEKSA